MTDLATMVGNLNLGNIAASFSMEESNIYDSFLIKYSNKDFLSKFLNVCLYQADFSVVAGIYRFADCLDASIVAWRKNTYFTNPELFGK